MAEEAPPGDEEFQILSRCSRERVYLRINSHGAANSEDPNREQEHGSQSRGSLNSSLQDGSPDELTRALDMIMDRSGDFHDPSNESFLNKPPICKAVELGEYSTVRSLLDAGFDISSKDSDGNSPLHLAISLKLYEILQLLLSRNCPLDTCNTVGYTPLHMAVINRDIHATYLILNTNHRLVLSFISQGVACPPIDLRALFSGDTCLHIATEQNCVEMVKLLVDNGANLNALNFHSQSPLILACRYEYSAIVSLLCSKGADPNLKGYFGNEKLTPLSLCSRLNKLEITRILVYYGADINASDDSGPSPLFTSLSHHSNEVTDFFFSQCLDKGLDVKLCRRNQETLLHALLEYKGDLKYQYVKDVIARGCPVNQATRSKNYPLHEAIGWRDAKMMTILLDLGADWRLLDRWGQNALHVAAATGVLAMVRILLYKGADINSLTTLGVTPLYVALEFDKIEVAEYLIDHGSDLRLEIYLMKNHPNPKLRNMAMDNSLMPSYLHSHPRYKKYVKDLANTPAKLLLSCVNKIRNIFSENHQLLANVYLLPIPIVLQLKLCFDFKRSDCSI